MALAKNEFELNHRVTYYEADPTGQVSPAMLINMVIEVSEAQSQSLGVGTDVVLQSGGGWVVTNYEIDIKKLPKQGDQVVLGTRATAYNRYFALREFWVRSLDGDEYAHISSMFVYMNLSTRKMVEIPEQIIAPFQSEQVKRIPRLTKPQQIDETDETTEKEYLVRYFDIDSNRHVNNAHYFDWMLDALSAEFLTTHQLTKMVIKFEQEVRYGETVQSQVTRPDQTQNDQLFTIHEISLDGDVHAIANCWWSKESV